MPRQPFNVALIGYGLAGAVFHAPLIRQTPGLRLAAVVTADAGRREHVRSAFPDAVLYEDVPALLSHSAEMDLVVVASPNRWHVPHAIAALDAGLGVVVDKPLAATSTQARRVVEHASRTGGMLTVFQNRRWDGDFLTVRRLVADGSLGDVWRFESRFERWVPTPKTGWREQADPAEGGGVLLDLGSHLVDQALLLFGPAAQVYSELDVRRTGAHVVDDAFVAITHRGGVRSHLWMGSAIARPAARYRVLGQRAGFTKFGMDVQEADLRSGMDPADDGYGRDPENAWGSIGTGEDVQAEPTLPGAYPAFYAALGSALRGQGPVPVDPMDAVATLEVIEAAQRSSLVGQVVSLPYAGSD